MVFFEGNFMPLIFQAVAIIQTGELEPSSSLIITKGKIDAPRAGIVKDLKSGGVDLDAKAAGKDALKDKIGKELKVTHHSTNERLREVGTVR